MEFYFFFIATTFCSCEDDDGIVFNKAMKFKLGRKGKHCI